MSNFFKMPAYFPGNAFNAVLMPDYSLKENTIYFCEQPERLLTPDQSRLLQQCSRPDSVYINTSSNTSSEREIDFLLSLATLGYIALKPVREYSQQNPCQILIISPHMDDAFLSIGGLILSYPERAKILVLDLFGNDPWCSLHERFWPTKEQINRIRAKEERFSAWMCHCDVQILNYPSSPLRGYKKWNGESEPCLDDAVKEDLINVLLPILQDTDWDAVLWPLGVGGHVDHRLARSLALDFLQNRHQLRKRFIYYEDLPYSAFPFHWHTWPPSNLLADMRPYYVPIKSSIFMRRHLLDIHRSQLVPNEAYQICQYAEAESMASKLPCL